MELLHDRRIQIYLIVLFLCIASIIFNGIERGFDLQGGSELKVKTEKPLDEETMDKVVKILNLRLNSAGLKDIAVMPYGDEFIIITIAGADPTTARKLVESQGKLEVKIGNITVFTGADLVRVSPYTKDMVTGAWQVPFTITEEAAKRFREAAIKTNFSLVYMYLDDKLVNVAPIGEDLKQSLLAGRIVRDLVLETGSGEEGRAEAERIEIVLRSGSLPIKLSVESVYFVPPTLGKEFENMAILAGIAAIIAVSVAIFVRYRQPKIVLPVIITGLSEVLIILGVASAINWQLDLPSIAGIIVAVGTGVDHQIIITDQILQGRSVRIGIRQAFFIITSAWLTTFFAMLPLFVVGLSALRGFALITMIGVTAGVYITRPAFARMLEYILR